MKDLGESRFIRGMDIYRYQNEGTLSISQFCYAEKIIERFGQENAQGINTPMKLNIDLIQSSPTCIEPHHKATGSSILLMVRTRPNLVYTILSKFAERNQPSFIGWL